MTEALPTAPEEEVGTEPLLRVDNLVVEYKSEHGASGKIHAVSDVGFRVFPGEGLGLVGESGCGKSSIARAVLQLPPPTSGKVVFRGQELTELGGEALRRERRNMQVIFQDPISSLNPRRKVVDCVADPLAVWGSQSREERRAEASRSLHQVGLDPDVVGSRHPAELSGGQCQRVAIARALMLEPSLLVCDEPTSALDVSVQAQILNLLRELQGRYGLSLLFISHDLAVVKNLMQRVAVMYLGKLCEVATADELYANPLHPYTQLLLASIPRPGTAAGIAAETSGGEQPSAASPPSGCRYRTRCPRAEERCAVEEPHLREVSPGHEVACHFPGPLSAAELQQK